MTLVGLLIAVLKCVFLAYAVSMFAIVISKSVLFEPLRRAVDRRFPKVGYALKCPLCMIGWTALPLVIFYRPEICTILFSASSIWIGFWVVDAAVSWLAIWKIGSKSYEKSWPFLEKHAPKMRIAWSARG